VKSDWSDSFSAQLKDRKSVPRRRSGAGERHLIRSAGVPADVLAVGASVIEQPNKIECDAVTTEKSNPNVLGVAGQVNSVALPNTAGETVLGESVAGDPATNSGSPADEKGQHVIPVKGGSLTLLQCRGRARSPSSVMDWRS